MRVIKIDGLHTLGVHLRIINVYFNIYFDITYLLFYTSLENNCFLYIFYHSCFCIKEFIYVQLYIHGP